MNGNVEAVYGIDENAVQFEMKYRNEFYSALINPNEEYAPENGKMILKNKVPFDYQG